MGGSRTERAAQGCTTATIHTYQPTGAPHVRNCFGSSLTGKHFTFAEQTTKKCFLRGDQVPNEQRGLTTAGALI